MLVSILHVIDPYQQGAPFACDKLSQVSGVDLWEATIDCRKRRRGDTDLSVTFLSQVFHSPVSNVSVIVRWLSYKRFD